jgi:hypothetical protein
MGRIKSGACTLNYQNSSKNTYRRKTLRRPPFKGINTNKEEFPDSARLNSYNNILYHQSDQI